MVDQSETVYQLGALKNTGIGLKRYFCTYKGLHQLEIL
jgi:hypothetical protein